MKKIVLILIFTLALIANENRVSTEVEVSGLVENTLKLDVKELEKMSYFKSGSVPVICMSGETKDDVQSYEGVLLKDIIDKAIIKVESGKEYNNVYFKVIATDGYQVIFSYNEVFNTKLGDNIIVFYKKNGKYLEDYQGKIALISIDDTKNGPRHIRLLEKIIVGKV